MKFYDIHPQINDEDEDLEITIEKDIQFILIAQIYFLKNK